MSRHTPPPAPSTPTRIIPDKLDVAPAAIKFVVAPASVPERFSFPSGTEAGATNSYINPIR